MPEFALYYFPGYGRVEALKTLLAHAGVDYEFIPIPQQDWPANKAKFGSLPAVEFASDGRIFNQAQSLMRLFGMKYGYYPLDIQEQYEVDMLSDFFNEIFNDLAGPALAPDEATKNAAIKKVFEQRLPYIMTVIKPRLDKGGWLVGNRMSTADFWYGTMYTSLIANPNAYGRTEFGAFLKANPSFEAYGKRFAAEHKRYLDSRQPSPI